VMYVDIPWMDFMVPWTWPVWMESILQHAMFWRLRKRSDLMMYWDSIKSYEMKELGRKRIKIRDESNIWSCLSNLFEFLVVLRLF
jgi:hypothetical protein